MPDTTLGTKPRPPVKWAGGKTQLLSQLRPLFPAEFGLYAEPFFGGGAVFFDHVPARSVLIDSNPELVNLYMVIRDHPDPLLEDLGKHENSSEYFYLIRGQDPTGMTPVARASRFIYLNKTAYNGLWRVNSKGQFNVPFGNYKKPRIVDEENLTKVQNALRGANIVCGDFSDVLKYAEQESFVYFDPPYHPLTKTANFTGYTKNSFGEEDQRRLADVFRQLDRTGCFVMLSNSDTEFIRDLYRDFTINVVRARRAINCRPDRRGPVSELVVRNYS